MPLILKRSNLKIETRRAPAQRQVVQYRTITTPEQQYFKLTNESGAAETGMKEAVVALGALLHNTRYARNAAVQGLRRYVGNMTPAHRAGDYLAGGSNPWIAPHWLQSGNWREFQQVHQAAETSEPVRFLGYEINMPDFVLLTHYMMTHTSLDDGGGFGGHQDPRAELIARISREENLTSLINLGER